MAENVRQDELPEIVRQIKRETEELIRLADQSFLHLCGIAWEDDIEQPSTAAGK